MGKVLQDGHPTTITFATAGAVKFYQRTLKAPSLSGGGSNNMTTFKNVRYRTKKPKKLVTVGDIEMTCTYESVVFDTFVGMMQVNQEITVTFEDGSNVKYQGWIEEANFNEFKEGEEPTVTIKIIISNIKVVSGADTEQGPVYTAAV